MKPLYGTFDYLQQRDYIQIGDIADPETFYHFANNSSFEREGLFQINHVAEVIGDDALYDTIAKANIYSPWKYMGQCKKGSTENKNPALMDMVYICSRYSGDTIEDVLFNTEIAKHVCEQAVKAGVIPIAPHLYFTRFLDDRSETERAFGMGAGKRLMKFCKTFYVVTVQEKISKGMDEEIKYMTEFLGLEGISINYTKEDAERIVRARMEK